MTQITPKEIQDLPVQIRDSEKRTRQSIDKLNDKLFYLTLELVGRFAGGGVISGLGGCFACNNGIEIAESGKDIETLQKSTVTSEALTYTTIWGRAGSRRHGAGVRLQTKDSAGDRDPG